MLIVYEGYEEPKQNQQSDDDPMLEEEAGNVMMGTSSTTEQGDNQVSPMEDDSRSGNCSYDADASNDSIELNLSLDEQQPFIKQSYSNHIQTNNLPVSIISMCKNILNRGNLFVFYCYEISIDFLSYL